MNPTSSSTSHFNALGRGQQNLHLASGRDVFDYRQRDMDRALRTHREIAHRLAPVCEHEIDHLGRGVTRPEIDRLRAFVGRDI